MDVLPSFLEVVDAAGHPLESRRKLERVATGSRSEAAWDEILVRNVEVFADALRQAEVIEEDSVLLHLGSQVDDVIDVLFAEVGQRYCELRRLVLVEDKLLRNHQAKREVLAQILEYAHRVQEEWPRADLAAKFRKHAPRGETNNDAWVEANKDALKHSCRCGEFLLVIAGDGISRELIRLARRFAGKDDPLSLTELALVSMALYKLGDEFLLAPHVVSAVLRSEREMTLRVSVRDEQGREVPADVVRDMPAESARASRRPPVREEVVAFFRQARELIEERLWSECPGLKATIKPRKLLEYELPLADGAAAFFKIQFGSGDAGEVWAPIQVGFGLAGRTTPTRDLWRGRLEATVGRLPAGTQLENTGPTTFTLMTSFDWSTSEDLNPALVAKVTETLLQFTSELLPLLRS